MGQITILVNYKAKHETREIFVNEVIESEILDKIKKEARIFSITTNFLTSSLNKIVNKLFYYLWYSA